MNGAARDPTLDLVRERVRGVLTRSPAYRALDSPQRRALAQDMVKVARFIVDAGGETAGVPIKALVATGLDRATDVQNVPDARTAGQKFSQQGGAQAAQSGAQALTSTIQRVNFPRFVAGLVDGVFNAIVTSSIKQMEAYGTLVANVAKSVDEYMRDNITENQARDYLAGKYPQHLAVDTKAKGGPKLVPVKGKRGRDGGRRPGGAISQSLAVGQPEMPDFMKDLGLSMPIQQLTPKAAEETLVPAARRRMAMDRQQLLATMVLMGINRLIVTDGKISASCLFTLDTTDTVTEDTTRDASFDEHSEYQKKGWGFWFFPRSSESGTADFSVSTTQTTSSTADVQMHSQLTGNVDLNFRSETFPLERMADLIQIREIEQKAPQAAAAPPAAPRPGMQLPPPPPLPPLPGFPGQAPAAPPATPPVAAAPPAA
jgi:hypothetical protein